MGLTATAKGLTQETCFDCGYITYNNFILEVVRQAYGEDLYNIRRNEVLYGKSLTDDEIELWNSKCNDDLDLLIFHSDCDGKFTWKECKRIYKALLPLKSDMTGHNYIVMKSYNMFEHWKNIFKHCSDRRVNLYYV